MLQTPRGMQQVFARRLQACSSLIAPASDELVIDSNLRAHHTSSSCFIHSKWKVFTGSTPSRVDLKMDGSVSVQLPPALESEASLNIYCSDPVDMAFWGYGDQTRKVCWKYDSPAPPSPWAPSAKAPDYSVCLHVKEEG